MAWLHVKVSLLYYWPFGRRSDDDPPLRGAENRIDVVYAKPTQQEQEQEQQGQIVYKVRFSDNSQCFAR